MGKTERKDGYYWVKFAGMWQVGYYIGGYFREWNITGRIEDFKDDELSQIGPRIPEYKPKKRKK